MARKALTAVTDRPEIAVQLSERLALSVSEAATAIGVSERLMRTVLPEIPHCHVGEPCSITLVERCLGGRGH
jgi:hypothetical protein